MKIQTNSRHYAAIDIGTITGAVYGIGYTPDQALESALDGGYTGPLLTVPCSREAAEYVDARGGSPSPRMHVAADGVSMIGE